MGFLNDLKKTQQKEDDSRLRWKRLSEKYGKVRIPEKAADINAEHMIAYLKKGLERQITIPQGFQKEKKFLRTVYFYSAVMGFYSDTHDWNVISDELLATGEQPVEVWKMEKKDIVPRSVYMVLTYDADKYVFECTCANDGIINDVLKTIEKKLKAEGIENTVEYYDRKNNRRPSITLRVPCDKNGTLL